MDTKITPLSVKLILQMKILGEKWYLIFLYLVKFTLNLFFSVMTQSSTNTKVKSVIQR